MQTHRLKLCHASVVFYIAWLMLPALQTTLGALGGICFVGLFGLSVLCDVPFMKAHGKWFLLAAVLTSLMPFVLAYGMDRGGSDFLGYYVQQGMFFAPILFVAYARKKEDRRLIKYLLLALFLSMLITTLTTTGWLIQGMTRGERVYAYSRSLGSGEPGREAYLKELMLRNIGGYGFVYATVLSLPITCFLTFQNKGKKRLLFAFLLLLQAVMVVLSQYTYAMLYTALILMVEAIGFFLFAVSKGKIPHGKGMLLGFAPLLIVLLLHEPLLQLGVFLCDKVGFTSFSFSLSQLLIALQGGITDSASRLEAYHTPLLAIGQSPLIGALGTGNLVVGYHSEVLDLLAGGGLIGTALVAGIMMLIGHQSTQGLSKSACFPHVLLTFFLLLVTATLGTVLYSNEISLVCMGVIAFATHGLWRVENG